MADAGICSKFSPFLPLFITFKIKNIYFKIIFCCGPRGVKHILLLQAQGMLRLTLFSSFYVGGIDEAEEITAVNMAQERVRVRSQGSGAVALSPNV